MSPGKTGAPAGEPVLSALAGLAGREAGGEAPPGADARGRARVLAAFREQSDGRSRFFLARPAIVRAGVVAVALAAAGALAVALPGRRPLAFTVDGAPASAGAYVHGTAERAAATVRFGDGTAIAFAPGAGGRVAEVGPHGARVLLETGTASFAVAHLAGARWSVEAGPYAVAVIGTTFDATWSVETQTLGVRLHAGEVAVTGPLAPNGVHLRAGQELTATVGGELRIGPLAAEPAHAAPASPRAEAPPAEPAAKAEVEGAAGAAGHEGGDPQPPATGIPVAAGARSSEPQGPPATATSRPVASTTARSPEWPRRVAAGDFRGVVADAEARGVEAVLGGAPLSDLAALADAARYAGRTDLARRALLAERARFSGSPEARAAAFLLGRIADDAGHDGGRPPIPPGPAGGAPSAAVRWYDEYLREAPGGAFAAEALGRKLAALRRAGDLLGARPVASDYLRRFPEGPYAAQARELVEAP